MKNLILLLLLFAFVFSVNAQTNAVINNIGNCHVDGDPNQNPDYQTIDQAVECATMKDVNTSTMYVYNPNGVPMVSRWIALSQNAIDEDTRLAYRETTATDIVFDVINVADGTDLDDVTIPLSDIQDGVITNLSFTGTGNERTGTIERSIGDDLSVNLNVEDEDADVTNEGSQTLGGTTNNVTITSNTSGSTPVNITSNGEIVATPDAATNTVSISTDASQIPEYLTNAAAVAALGAGKKAKYAQGSLEGSRGTQFITY